MVNIFSPKTTISGHYSIKRMRASSGEVTGQWDFKNIITNNGLNLWGTTSGSRYNTCSVGSGSSVPSPTNTELDAIIASTTTSTPTSGFNGTDLFAWTRRQYQFGVGVAAGNISEVAVGVTSTNLFSRALVLDSMGVPTSITILSDEILQVVYEVRNYVPQYDFEGTFTLTGNSGGTYDYVGRAAMASAGFWSSETGSDYRGANNSAFYLSTGDIGGVAGGPVYGAGGSGGSAAAYVQDSFTRLITTSFNLSSGNQTSKSMRLTMGAGAYQFQFNPPIVKNNTQQLSIITSHSWGRA